MWHERFCRDAWRHIRLNGDAIVAAIVDVDGVYEGESLLAFRVRLSESELPFARLRDSLHYRNRILLLKAIFTSQNVLI